MHTLAKHGKAEPLAHLGSCGPMPHGANVGKPRRRLAMLVKARRLELGMRSQKALATSVGIATRSVGSVERGEYVGESTLLEIDRALGWEAGSCQVVLDGGEPVLVATVRTDQELMSDELRENLRVLKRAMPYPEFVRVVAELLLPPEQTDTESGPTSDIG